MSTSVISSINLCPINFEAFGQVNRITENMEATLLFSKIKFHQVNSVIESGGKTWIIRSRKQLAEWFQFTEKKIDALLSLLDEKGLVQKIVRLWHGKKALMLHASTEVLNVPIHHQKFSSLVEYIGNIHSTIIFSKIAFHFNNSQINHENKKWCSIKKEILANWAGISIRKLDGIIEELIKSGVLLKKNFIWYGKRQIHFHIPNFAKEVIYEHISEAVKQSAIPVATTLVMPSSVNTINDIVDTNVVKEEGRGEAEKTSPYTFICLSPSAKIGKSIGIRSNIKKTKNNSGHNLLTERKSDITLINSKLTYQQEKYLEGALRKTLTTSQISVTNQSELLDELKFSVSNIDQHKGITSFHHAVSRCMKIIAQNNWKTPIGFYTHSNIGKSIKEKRAIREEQWNKYKNLEKDMAQSVFTNIGEEKAEINSHVTDQGIKFAKQVLSLKNTENSVLASAILSQIHHLISQGANGKAIAAILKCA